MMYMTFVIYDVWCLQWLGLTNMMFVALWRLSYYDVCRIMTFFALWHLSFMMFVTLCWLLLMTFVALWRLSHYDVCRIMTFVVYDVCRIMMFVALGRLSSIMTFVAYRVCCSILHNVHWTLSRLAVAASQVRILLNYLDFFLRTDSPCACVSWE